MQYPVIDLITQAYLNNGWTGLDISTGKNLAYIDLIGYCPSISTGDIIQYSLAVTSNYIKVNQNTNYTLTIYSDISNITSVYLFYYREDNSFISYRNLQTSTNTWTTLIPLDCEYVYIRLDKIPSTTDIPIIQFENGTISTPYEPYSEPKNDFPNRLKLPLPHYFPHPVIDALQRAAAGTQTADDTEILRHYLTPLGIGGI